MSDSASAGGLAGGTTSRPSSTTPGVSWWTILRRVFRGIQDDRITSIAAGVSFFVLLAIVPGLAGLISLYGLVADTHTVAQHLQLLAGVLPEGALQILGEQLDRLTSQPAQKLSLATGVALALSLWSANGGVKALCDALNIAYETRERRGFIRLTLVSLALTVGGIVFLIVSLMIMTLVPTLLAWIGKETASLIVTIIRWPLLLVVTGLCISVVYRFAPSFERPRWRWITPGSVFATVLWLIASFAFSWYTEHFGSYDKTYGSLGALVGFMTWMWLSTIVILIGARLNREIERAGETDESRNAVVEGPPLAPARADIKMNAERGVSGSSR